MSGPPTPAGMLSPDIETRLRICRAVAGEQILNSGLGGLGAMPHCKRRKHPLDVLRPHHLLSRGKTPSPVVSLTQTSAIRDGQICWPES
jgi:hypothetical protein